MTADDRAETSLIKSEEALTAYGQSHPERSAAEDGMVALMSAGFEFFCEQETEMIREAGKQRVAVRRLAPWAHDAVLLMDWVLVRPWKPGAPPPPPRKTSPRLRHVVKRPLPRFRKTLEAGLPQVRALVPHRASSFDDFRAAIHRNIDARPCSNEEKNVLHVQLDRALVFGQHLSDDDLLLTGHRLRLAGQLANGKKLTDGLALTGAPTLQEVYGSEELLRDFGLWNSVRDSSRGVPPKPRGRNRDDLPFFFLRGLDDHFRINGFGEVQPRDAELIATFWGFDAGKGATARWQQRLPKYRRAMRLAAQSTKR